MPINVAKKPIYESFSMIHPDGTKMCYTNEKKARWYIERGLAHWLDEAKGVFQLDFVPEGKGKSGSAYYTQSLENKCVVCADASPNLNKHHVVPYVFRSRFPVQYKESNHHDILVTCVNCHEDYEEKATQYKKELASKVGMSINAANNPAVLHNRKIRSARKVLAQLQEGSLMDKEGKPVQIPAQRLQMLQATAQKDLMPEEPPDGVAWADKIVDDVLQRGALFDFIKSWRAHFLEHAKPRYLPEHWSVDYPLESSRQKK